MKKKSTINTTVEVSDDKKPESVKEAPTEKSPSTISSQLLAENLAGTAGQTDIALNITQPTPPAIASTPKT